MCRVPDNGNCPGRSWGGPRVMLCNRTSRFQASLPRKMESAVGRWEIPNKSKRILQEDWSRRKVKLISQKYFNLIVYLWSIFQFVQYQLEQAVLFKFQSLENITHICQQNNLFPFWFEENIPLYTRDFWKISPIILVFFLSHELERDPASLELLICFFVNYILIGVLFYCNF